MGQDEPERGGDEDDRHRGAQDLAAGPGPGGLTCGPGPHWSRFSVRHAGGHVQRCAQLRRRLEWPAPPRLVRPEPRLVIRW